jgi:hypothetical protein
MPKDALFHRIENNEADSATWSSSPLYRDELTIV